VRPAQGAPVAAIELWYRAPSTGFGPKPQPSIARLAAQAVAASKPIIGDPLGKLVRDIGGRLAITVYTDSVEISALVPASGARAIVKAMTTAYFAPVTTEQGFRSAQRDVGQEALFSPFDVETVVRDAVFSELFTDGPQHYPTVGDAKGIGSLAYDDVKSFAARAFRAQNATLVISGAVDPSVAAAAVPGRSDEPAAEPPVPGQLAASPALGRVWLDRARDRRGTRGDGDGLHRRLYVPPRFGFGCQERRRFEPRCDPRRSIHHPARPGRHVRGLFR
jgi:predicted Zn-dependent peptidase